MNADFEECLRKKRIWEFSRGQSLVEKELKTAEKDLADGKLKYKRQAMRFAGFISEGVKLTNSCHQEINFKYATKQQYDSVKRSMVATLQYIGLDIAVRAIAEYANNMHYVALPIGLCAVGLIASIIGLASAFVFVPLEKESSLHQQLS